MYVVGMIAKGNPSKIISSWEWICYWEVFDIKFWIDSQQLLVQDNRVLWADKGGWVGQGDLINTYIITLDFWQGF